MGINISISNFAKIKKANVTINGLTVISGENDTGKSTVGKVVYSLIKSISTYKTSGINVIKKAILNQMDDTIRLIGRLMQRKTKNFTQLRDKIFYYIPNTFLYKIDSLFYPNIDIAKKFEDRLNAVELSYLIELAHEIDKFANKKDYWNDSLLKDKIRRLLYMTSVYQNEGMRLSVNLGIELRASIGDMLINSLYPNDKGKISLLLNNQEVLSLNVNTKDVDVTKYDADNFEYMFDDATYLETPLLINE